jgi:serine/threonine-protein kinase
MMDYRTVEIKLEKIGMKSTVRFEKDDIIPVGMVIRTDPEKGTIVSKDTVVTLYVSDGPDVKKVEMPNLVGKTLEQAKQMLENYQLNDGNITYQESDRPKGEILQQSVDAGTEISSGSDIHLVVSQGATETAGPTTVKLSNFAGQHIDDVREAIEALELRYTIIPEYNDNQANGYVIKTYPAAGSDVTPSSSDSEGTMINIYVSQGSKPVETEPPATEPPATTPPATEPPATEPTATEPPATEAAPSN